MAFSLVGWSESIDSATLTDIQALLDQHVTTDGDDILVPAFASNIIGVLVFGGYITGAQISSPTLRKGLMLDVAPVHVSSAVSSFESFINRLDRPIALTPGEGLRARVSESSSSGTRVVVLAWLQGEYEEPPEGEIHTVKATSTTTLTPYEWTLCPLSLTQQLEAGRYALVGARVESANAIAARFVIPGSEYRPGVIACHAVGDRDGGVFRAGRFGMFGEFEHTFIPQVEVLSAGPNTAEVVYLDVVKI